MKQFKTGLLFILLWGACLISFVTGCKHDSCKGVTCLNNGICNSGACNCPYYATGKFCDTLIRQQFIDSFSGTLTSSTSSGAPGSITITAGPDSLSEITLTFYGLVIGGDTVHGVGYRNGSLVVPSQGIATGNGGSLGTGSGSGTLTGTTLYDTMIVNSPYASGTFYFTGTKQ